MPFTTNQISGCISQVYTGRTLRLFCCTFLILLLASVTASGAENGKGVEELTELSLERLLDVSVISASRKSQTLADVSSAVFVINQDDIRHSGATTIPDLLRMVPGVQVASIDGSKWSISIRGFNGPFANKLLVMIDGRSVYTPLYGGVFWDVQDTMLENIERIEVIRGSGGTMWGANAVNGVINIITKSAHDTQGTVLTGLTGTRENGTVAASYGDSIGDSTSYRLYAKHVERGDTYPTTGSAADSLRISRGGFRIDSAPGDRLRLTLQGDLYGGTADNTITIPTFAPPFSSTKTAGTDLFGANILSRLDWVQSESSKSSIQLYYDRTGRDYAAIKENRDTVDFDLQHNLRFSEYNEITLGAGYRFLHDQTTGTPVFSLSPESRSDRLLSLFVQDEITLLPETLRFTVGTKLEHNDYTGWELQPSARFSWTPRSGYSLWGAVTRSVRTPTRGEQDARITAAIIPAVPPSLPSSIVLTGNRDMASEWMLAYELGFRADLNENISMDITTFYNQYHGMRSTQAGTPFIEGGTQIIPMYFGNLYDYESSGGEMALQWQPRDWWKLKGGYAYIRFFGEDVGDSQAVSVTPTHQATLRSMMAFGRDVDLDLWARFVGDSRYPMLTETVSIPSYVTLDVRLAWRPVPGVELSLVGQNLLEQRHLEALTDANSTRHEIERTIYAKVTWAY